MGTNPIFGIVILKEPEESNFHVMGAKARVNFSEVFLLDTLQRSQEAPDTKALNSQQIDTLAYRTLQLEVSRGRDRGKDPQNTKATPYHVPRNTKLAVNCEKP